MNAAGDVLAALSPVVDALERLGVTYLIGGSVASSVHGTARSTMDVDLVADMALPHVGPFVAALGDAFYADDQSIRDAIANRSSFNVIHMATAVKVDVFVPKNRPYDREALRRRTPESLEESPGARSFQFASAEDIVLAKLDWFQRGGRVSERQWTDILGVMRVQASALDLVYLQRWAPALSVTDLLDRALAEAGLA